MQYITHTLTIGTHATATDETRKLAGCAMHNLLPNNNPLHTYLHFYDTIAVRYYLIIHKFWGDTRLTPHGQNTHDSFDIFKKDLTLLIHPLTIDAHK